MSCIEFSVDSNKFYILSIVFHKGIVENATTPAPAPSVPLVGRTERTLYFEITGEAAKMK